MYIHRTLQYSQNVLTKFSYLLINFWHLSLTFKLGSRQRKYFWHIWHIDQSLQRACKKAEALENIFQEMNVAGWYITHHMITMQHWEQKHDWPARADCTLFNWVSCIANSRRQLSFVGEGVYNDATQLNSTQLDVELSWVASAKWL